MKLSPISAFEKKWKNIERNNKMKTCYLKTYLICLWFGKLYLFIGSSIPYILLAMIWHWGKQSSVNLSWKTAHSFPLTHSCCACLQRPAKRPPCSVQLSSECGQVQGHVASPPGLLTTLTLNRCFLWTPVGLPHAAVVGSTPISGPNWDLKINPERGEFP